MKRGKETKKGGRYAERWVPELDQLVHEHVDCSAAVEVITTPARWKIAVLAEAV